MRFEIHCHTKHSNATIPWDGLESPADAVRQAKKAGLSGIAITDHDSIKAWKEAKEETKRLGLAFIPGIEVNSRHGHILGLGVSDSVPRGMGVEATIEAIHDQGGIAIAAHPFDIRNHGIRHWFSKADAVEAFNALSLDRFSNRFTESRARGMGMSMVSGSDAHSLGMIGTAAVSADACDMDSLLKAIKAGRTGMCRNYVSIYEMKEWNRRRMINAYFDIMRYVDSRYGGARSWVIKHAMRRFMFSESAFWDILARAGVVGAMGYGGVKVLSYY